MFTSHASTSPLSMRYLFTVFYALTVYNATEVIILIFVTFKRYWGCYFSSLLVTALGLIVSTAGNTYYFFNYSSDQIAPISLALIGWCGFVTGQAIVLWSRLHIVIQNRRILTGILAMIVTNTILLCPTTIVLSYLGNNTAASDTKATNAYHIWEDIQLSLFTAQEAVIAGAYIWQILRLSNIFSDASKRKTTYQLLAINAIILMMDVVLLGVQFSGNRDVQIPLKGLIYSLKLKLEFAVLGRLVSFSSHPHGSFGSNGEHVSLGSA